MPLRRATDRIKVSIGLIAGALTFALSALAASPVAAKRLPSEKLPQAYLEACDDRAAPFGAYDRSIAAAVEDLTDIGVFEEAEFHDVKIGFCDLRKVRGPAGTTSCAHDTILLDSGYAARDQGLVLKATLAHEMKHVFQHRRLKAELGEDYCFTDRYAADKGWMEREADAFGDEVAALLFLGRKVEIRNDCPVAVSVYLEADRPLSTGDALGFITAPAHSITPSPERSVSKAFKLYAETAPGADRKKVWGDRTMAHTRRIKGGLYRLKSIALPNAERATGPFQLMLSCDADRNP